MLDDINNFLDSVIEDTEDVNLDFVLINEMGYSIYEIYVAPSNETDWGEDVMDEDTILDDGESLDVSMDIESRQRYWDLRIIDEEEEELVFERINLSEVSQITVYYENGDAMIDTE